MASNTKVAALRRGRFRRECGQGLLEVAMLTPLLLLLTLGAIEIGRYASKSLSLGNAARAGVAYGAQDHFYATDDAGITKAACQDFEGQNTCSLSITKAYVCQCDNGGTVNATPIDCGTGSCPSGTREVVSLQVTAGGTFTSLFNYPGIPSQVTVTRSATMRLWK